MLNSLALPSTLPPYEAKHAGKRNFTFAPSLNPIAPPPLPALAFHKGPVHDRWPRITENQRNRSSYVFLQPLTQEKETYLSSEETERRRRREEQKDREKFWSSRRLHRDQLENERWKAMHQKEKNSKERLLCRREKSRFGESSVGYNLISSQYLGGPRGEKQKSLDNLALLKFERREKEIFAKSNSFDPIQNIPCKSPSELQLLSIKDNGIRVIIKPKA